MADAGEDISGGKKETNGEQNLEQVVFSLIKQRRGLAKLRLPRPSTAFIGNWGVKQVVAQISNELPLSSPGLRVDKLLCKNKAIRRIKSSDSLDDILQQWMMLWTAYMSKQSALIIHLKNHYALVYALREHETKDGKHKREILTAKKGQTPKTWIDFNEFRESMLKWAGYCILVIKTVSGETV